MADYGITVAAQGSNAQTAKGSAVLLSAKYPFEKLDSTNLVSFQNINFIFTHEPPTPATPTSSGAPNTNKTLVYSFAHGYNYTPRWWVLIKNNAASPYKLFGYDSTQLAVGDTADTNAVFTTEVTSTMMNFYVSKSVGYLATVLPNVQSIPLAIRTYIFVDQLPLS
jgi:hypothetical protein